MKVMCETLLTMTLSVPIFHAILMLTIMSLRPICMWVSLLLFPAPTTMKKTQLYNEGVCW